MMDRTPEAYAMLFAFSMAGRLAALGWLRGADARAPA